MNSDPNRPMQSTTEVLTRQVQSLSRKVDRLTGVIVVQTALLVALTASYLLKIIQYVFFVLLILVPFVVIFRSALPRRLGQTVNYLWRSFRRDPSTGSGSTPSANARDI